MHKPLELYQWMITKIDVNVCVKHKDKRVYVHLT